MKKIIRFTASWCGPCKMLAKTLENIQTNIPIEVIDIDERQDVAMEYGIRGVPTLVKVEDGTVLDRMIGVHSQKELKEWIEK